MLKLRPSQSYRWVKCTAFPAAADKVKKATAIDESGSDAAIEGKAAHWLAEQMLTSGDHTPSKWVGEKTPFDVTVDEEMYAAVKQYVVDILTVANQRGLAKQIKTNAEQKVTIDRVHPSYEGTPDMFLHDGPDLWVWDFKYGRRYVDHLDNYQLASYATGLIDNVLGCNGQQDEHVTVHMRIVQPRAFSPLGTIREWTITGDYLRNYANVLHYAYEQVIRGEGQYKPGLHCANCPVAFANKSACPGAVSAALNAVDTVDHVGDPFELDTVDHGLMLSILRNAKRRIDNMLEPLEEETLTNIEKGEFVEGWTTERGRGSFIFKEDLTENQIMQIGKIYGVDLRKRGVLTPNQAKDLVNPDVIDQLAERRPGKLKLVQVDKTLAHYAFTKLK